MKENYLLLHGSFGSPFVNWFPYLRKNLENREKTVYTPDMPTGVGYQNYENWSNVIKAYLNSGIIGENTVIFAHSIAPVFVSHFLIENKIRVKRLIFVCGFNNYLGIDDDYDNVNKSMFFDDLSLIHDYCDEIICLYTDNDPYVDYKKEKEFADIVADKQIIIPGGGHLNSESGYEEFDKLLEFI